MLGDVVREAVRAPADQPAGQRLLDDRAEAHPDPLVDHRLQQPAALLERDVVERLALELDEVDGHERAPALGLERVGDVLGQPLGGERLGPGARRAAVADERLRGPDAVDARASSARIAAARISGASAISSSSAHRLAELVGEAHAGRRRTRAIIRVPGQSGSNSHSTLSTSAFAVDRQLRQDRLVHHRQAYRRAAASVQRPVVEVELAFLDVGADLGADRLPGVEVPLADEGDGGPLLAGAAGAADAVDVRVGVLGDVVRDDVRQVGDVEAAAGDVGRDQELDLAGPEGREGAVALALREAAVEAGHVLAAPLEGRGQPVDADLRVAEDEQPVEAELVGQLEERRDLVLLGHEVDDLADGLDRLEVGADRDVGRDRAS